MNIDAGFFGCEQNNKKEVSLVLGWLVSPSTLCNNVKEDTELKNDLIFESDLYGKEDIDDED